MWVGSEDRNSPYQKAKGRYFQRPYCVTALVLAGHACHAKFRDEFFSHSYIVHELSTLSLYPYGNSEFCISLVAVSESIHTFVRIFSIIASLLRRSLLVRLELHTESNPSHGTGLAPLREWTRSEVSSIVLATRRT